MLTFKTKILFEKPALIALSVLIISLTGLIILYSYSLKNEKQAVYEKYQQRAELQTKDIEAEIKRSFFQVSSIANLYSSSGWVSHSEFSQFVRRVFPNFPKNRRISAIHHIPASYIDDYLTNIRQNPTPEYEKFSIFDYSAPNELSEATTTDNFYNIISYTFPAQNIANFLGRSIVESSPISPLIFPAIELKKPIVSDFSPPLSTIKDEPFIIYVHPFFSIDTVSDDSSEVSGLIVSSQSISDFFINELISNPDDNYRYILIDSNKNAFHFPSNTLRSFDSTLLAELPTIHFQFTIRLINNRFELIVIPNDQQLADIDSLLYPLFIVGIILIFAISFITYSLLSRQKLLTREVKRKTSAIYHQRNQLSEQNRRLIHAVEAAKISANAKSEFLANMSHEIRTPLNGVIGLTELLNRTQLDVDQKEYVEKLIYSGRHLLSVINDILDFSKVESGKVDLEISAFSIFSIIDNLNGTFQDIAKARGIDFKVSIEGYAPPDLMGDIFRINQVLMNLCSNAIKFTEKGRVDVIISMNKVDDKNNIFILRFQVKDTGIGINEKDIATLFSNFSQADSSTTRKYGGTGLGLSISQKLCQAMGGDINLTSTKGKGSIFTAFIKIQLNTDILIDEHELTEKHKTLINENVEVLIVDDNPIALNIISNYLASINMTPITAQSAEEGLDILQNSEHKIKLIISDWTMPHTNGGEFVQELLTLNMKVVPKVIILSAYETSSIEKAREALPIIKTVLQKPCPTEVLHQAIISVLKNKTPVKETMIIQKRLEGINILVAEDNNINQLVINKILTAEGADITMVNNGVEAIKVINAPNKIDIILMDIHMPIMDGVETTKIIRSSLDKKLVKLPIIALTANVLESDVKSYLAVGMNAHESKPIIKESLISTILSLIK
ncbi:response regulator [Thalassotalea castellviae]|uniref:histidine kinase n=1 Tax=Thalassotalea castellviae TaxID=3075612 RepID=A0ABU3A2P0_9GAMM|nr:response regulator [Thalassotalea sp. W431]MDT0604446.1 response regulator [Thalassotalea sp. W431]